MGTNEIIQSNNDSNSIEVVDNDFDLIKQEYKNSAEVNDIYNNPVVKSGLKFFLGRLPFWGDLVEAGLDWGFNQYQNKKQEILRDAILESKELITRDKVNDVEFICNLLKTSEMVSRLATDDKIAYFGNLVRNGYLHGSRITNDDFDEYAAILSELSYREIQYLIEFARYARINENELCGKKLKDYCDHMLESYPKINPVAVLNRLRRTGFVNEQMAWADDEDDEIAINGVDESLHLGGDAFSLDPAYSEFERIVLQRSR